MCTACGMLIGDARFASALITVKDEPVKFDDLGETFMYVMDHPDLQPKAWFVHDYASAAWIRGETAFYVMSPQIASPMGSGLAAFEAKPAAEAFAAERSAQVLTFDEARAAMHEKMP